MPDPVTVGGAVGSAAAAYLLKDGVTKLLGPTCEYIGKEAASWVEKKHRNVERIMDSAIRRIGGKINDPGEVPSRVLRDVINEEAWIDDALVAEYFGGILAGSRSNVSGEDISFTYIQTLKGLTATQIKFHYLIYRAIHLASMRRKYTLSDKAISRIVYIPIDDISGFLSIAEGSFYNVLKTCTQALQRADLIPGNCSYGNQKHNNKHIKNDVVIIGEYKPRKFPTEYGYCCAWKAYGVDLFMHVHGVTKYQYNPLQWGELPTMQGFDLQLSDGVCYVEELPFLEKDEAAEASLPAPTE